MTPLEQELYAALKEIEDAQLAVEKYRWEYIGSYPDVKIPEDVRAKWNADLDALSVRTLKARKTAQKLIAKIEGENHG